MLSVDVGTKASLMWRPYSPRRSLVLVFGVMLGIS
jgi:hypothetical protein